MSQKMLHIAAYKAGRLMAEAMVPYEEGAHSLPSVPPFNENVYVGPDAGFTLSKVFVEADGRIIFGYRDYVNLTDGVGEYTVRLHGEEHRFVFEVRETE